MSSLIQPPPPARKPRPYWHADLKWLTGLLAVVTVGGALLLVALLALTNEANGTKILTLSIAGLFSPKGLDDGGDLAGVRELIAQSPDKKFYPIPGAQLAITEADLAKSPRQLRLDLFEQLAGPLYRQDPVEIATLAPQAELRGNLTSSLGVGALFTRPAHDRLAGYVRYPLIASVGLGLLLVYFSFGWGRLASPGWVLIAATVFPFLFTGAFAWGVIRWTEAPPPTGESITGGMMYVASLLVPVVVATLHPVYAQFFWIGVGLVGASMLGASIWHFVKPKPTAVRQS